MLILGGENCPEILKETELELVLRSPLRPRKIRILAHELNWTTKIRPALKKTRSGPEFGRGLSSLQ